MREAPPSGTAPVRARIAAAIATVAARHRYDGMTLDLEQLPVAESGAFTRLVTLVAGRLHADHRRLAVYVPRRTAQGGDAFFFARGRVVHFQTAAALAARAGDARDVGMRWLALFSLGREPDAFWSRVRTARQAG